MSFSCRVAIDQYLEMPRNYKVPQGLELENVTPGAVIERVVEVKVVERAGYRMKERRDYIRIVE